MAEGAADEVAGGATGEAALDEVVAMMRRLRVECGWKAAQTHRSLARHLLEECHELVEVLDQLDPAVGSGPGDVPVELRDHLREELGDVLLQVLFHAAVAEESGWFDVQDVAAALRDKLLRRNPHVFGGPGEAGAGEQNPVRINELWEQAKAAERPREDLLEGIAPTLPALATAAKVLDRRERAGLTAPPTPAPDGDLGDRLLALVGEAVARGVDPEQALRDALRRLPS